MNRNSGFLFYNIGKNFGAIKYYKIMDEKTKYSFV